MTEGFIMSAELRIKVLLPEVYVEDPHSYEDGECDQQHGK